MTLLTGTAAVLVPKTFAWGAMHAFEIAAWLEARSGGRLAVEDAALTALLAARTAAG